MKKQIFLVFAALLGAFGLNSVRADFPDDGNVVRGEFTVGINPTNQKLIKVAFAHGNLQYKTGKKTWSFADHQYDIVGAANSQIGNNSLGVTIDLFGWGTQTNPTEYSCASCATSFPIVGNDPDNNGTWDAAGRRNAPMDGEYTWAEWGDNLSGTWRTLTAEEWNHLFFGRDHDLFGLGKVNGVNGLILLPDNWEMPPSLNFTSLMDAGWTMNEEGYFTNNDPGSYKINVYTAVEWQSMENNGAVFLPAAGSRAGQECSNIGEYGYYWSSTPDEEDAAFSLGFNEMLVAPMVGEPRASGQAVRLVWPLDEEEDPTGGSDDAEAEINENFTFHPFTVSEGYQVSFSQGNLQYQPAPGKVFRFAAKQNEFMAESNAHISSSYQGWMDLFVYGMGKEPAKVCETCIEYGGEMGEGDDGFDSPSRRKSPMNDENGVPNFEDFGYPNNTIANGGNDQWRTLTANEWEYLFVSRDNARDRFGFGTVDGVNGLIVLPDDWELPDGCSFVPAKDKMEESDGVFTGTATETVYSHNTYYTTNQSWQLMEAAGAVFLPAAGMRSAKDCSDFGDAGYYMSSTEEGGNTSKNVFLLNFNNAAFSPKFLDEWDRGRSVRLVKPYTEEPEEEHTLTIEVDPAGSGYVTENDEEIWSVDMVANETMVLTAVANPDKNYEFDKWDVIGGEINDPKANPVTFTMGSADATLTAHFIPVEPEEPEPHNLYIVINPTEGGVVKVNADDLAEDHYTMTEDEQITFYAEANDSEGYEFVNWTLTVAGVPSTYEGSEIQITMGQEDVTLTANFRPTGTEPEQTWVVTGHSWSEDYSACTVTLQCVEDPLLTKTEDCEVESEVTKEPTCKENGETTYTATYDNTVVSTETVANIEALDHDWQTPVYTWSEDLTECTATLPCARDHEHDIVETVTTVPTTTGTTTVYTATFDNPAFEPQTRSFTPFIQVTMSQYGFLSLYADKAYTVPAGLNAIIYTGVINGKNLSYQKLTVIPAYTGVVLYAKANETYTLYQTETSVTYPENMLHGTLEDTPIPDNGNVHYILSYCEEKGLAGLLWPKDTNRGVGEFINHAGKAYLEIPSGMNVAPRFFTMRGEACEEGTAVDETQADGDGKYYDILGREVAEPQPQQIYIRNGQKVLYNK